MKILFEIFGYLFGFYYSDINNEQKYKGEYVGNRRCMRIFES